MFITSVVLAQVSTQEKQVLIDMYEATNGLNWNNPWNLDTPVETWHGITVKDNKVTEINLLFNNLNGPLPASLGQLKYLKKLELSFNPISGTIPAELGNLELLEVLAINGTAISGFIPESLGNLSNLKQLHLSSNQLSGIVPESLGALPQIEVFNVFDNDLYGSLPKGFSTRPNLRELIVAENNFDNPQDFSVVLLSNSGAKLDLQNDSPKIEPNQPIIAVERDDNED